MVGLGARDDGNLVGWRLAYFGDSLTTYVTSYIHKLEQTREHFLNYVSTSFRIAGISSLELFIVQSCCGADLSPTIGSFDCPFCLLGEGKASIFAADFIHLSLD
jgi:hypothetical protein